jgi:hypothetical protein
MPQIKLSKTYVLKKNKNEKQQNCNSYELMKIWSNSKHSKVPNYDLVKVNKEHLLI